MAWLNRIFGKDISANRNACKPIKRSVQLQLEILEERWVPYSDHCAFAGSLSGAFLNNGDVLNLSNISFTSGSDAWTISN